MIRCASASSIQINTPVIAVLRRARGMIDDEMLLLTTQVDDGPPDSISGDLAAFLTAQPLYSNR
jgi:hypothetical protein